MVLDKDLVKQFAAVMAPASKEKTDGKIYGTVSKIETVEEDGVSKEITYVELDGSGLETPVDGSVVCAVGDRVLVQIRNHKAYISDNFTAPPNGRAGDKYYYFDEERGMIIGRLDPETHEPTGNYVLITDTDYRICDEDGNVLAIFADANIDLGANSSSAKIYFCDRNGNISYSGNTLVLEGDDATGLKSVRSNGAASQVAVAANNSQLAAAMSILNSSGTVNGQVGVEYEQGVGTHVRLRGVDASFNNNTLLTSNNLICVGTATIKGNLAANKGRTYSATVSVPSGFTLAGIRRITTNHQVAIVMSGFRANPSNNTVSAYLKNVSIHGTTYSVTVTIEWFAFRTNSTTSGGSIDIDLSGDGDDE